jgi:hypothetical protein
MKRVSHEALILNRIRLALADLPGATYTSGMGGLNGSLLTAGTFGATSSSDSGTYASKRSQQPS